MIISKNNVNLYAVNFDFFYFSGLSSFRLYMNRVVAFPWLRNATESAPKKTFVDQMPQ